MSDLHGKVMLVDFWEYTCINCIRTFPYLRCWDKLYRPLGPVIVGVHTPSSSSPGIRSWLPTLGLSLYSFTFGNNWENKFAHR